MHFSPTSKLEYLSFKYKIFDEGARCHRYMLQATVSPKRALNL